MCVNLKCCVCQSEMSVTRMPYHLRERALQMSRIICRKEPHNLEDGPFNMRERAAQHVLSYTLTCPTIHPHMSFHTPWDILGSALHHAGKVPFSYLGNSPKILRKHPSYMRKRGLENRVLQCAETMT